MTEQDCQPTREMLEAYALGALDEDERASIDDHLRTCADCRRLADELIETAHKLPLAVGAASPLRPPATLKARVLGQVAPEKGGESQRRWWWRPSVALALVSLVLAGLFAAWNARLDDALSQERDLRVRLARLQIQQELVLEVVDSRETRKAVLLPPAGSESRAYGKVFTRADMRHVVALAARLPQPRPDHAYHLWLTTGRGTRLARVLPVDSSGFGLVLFDADRAGPVYKEARLIEQLKGSRRPSGEPILLWRASR
jgi:hypothetical protein